MHTIKTLVLVLLTAWLSPAQKPAVVLNTTEFKEAVSAPSVQLLDVRTAKEFANGHIENAIHADILQAESFRKKARKLDRDKSVYIYCKSGNRSKTAAKELRQMGFEDIYDLKGGYMLWK